MQSPHVPDTDGGVSHDACTCEPLAYAQGVPAATAVIRSSPEDFQVDEILGFEPDGAGEHALLHIRKRNTNTEWVARTLARHAGVRGADVGYAGLKDRVALTSQWFSVHLPGRADPDWRALESQDIQVLAAARHGRKLRRGTLRGNRFRLVLRAVQGDHADIERRLAHVQRHGAPNYFGPQRFGRDGGNLRAAYALLVEGRAVRDRHRRGLLLSAARSLLFNRALSARVADGSWERVLAGDVMMLDGSHSIFAVGAPDSTLEARVAALDIHPTGPLWGRGTRRVEADAAAREDAALHACGTWCRGLEQAGLTQERRALRMRVGDLVWRDLAGGSLELEFTLPAGCYATSVLREIVRLDAPPAEGDAE